MEKVIELDSHIGAAMSGLTADARSMFDHARTETQNHRFTYNEPMPVESCTQARERERERFFSSSQFRSLNSRAPPPSPPCRACVTWPFGLGREVATTTTTEPL